MMLLIRSILERLLGHFSVTKPKDTSIKIVNTDKKIFITYKDWAMGRDKEFPPSAETVNNARNLLLKVNLLLNELNSPFYGISSGYRPPKYNKAAGGAKRSGHLTGEAVDLRDRGDQSLAKELINNQALLEKHGLYMEDPRYTKGKNTPWVHLQTRPTKKRIFIPY